MKLSSDILFQDLTKHFSLVTAGKKRTSLSLEAPIFYYSEMSYENDRVYIGRIGELPPPPKNISCQIICVGGRLPASWNAGNSCAFSIVSEADILSVFNIVQNTFLRYGKWNSELYHLLNTTANLEEMIRLTSNILGKSVSLVNNQLEIVTQAISDDDKWHPASWVVVLFDHFFEIFRLALAKNLNHGHGTMVTLKSVFSDLLNCLPVTPVRLEKTCRNSGHNPAAWICAALRPTGSMEQLPPEYFCKQLELLFKKCYAISFSGRPWSLWKLRTAWKFRIGSAIFRIMPCLMP